VLTFQKLLQKAIKASSHHVEVIPLVPLALILKSPRCELNLYIKHTRILTLVFLRMSVQPPLLRAQRETPRRHGGAGSGGGGGRGWI
jgi:hypothetical protein